MRFVRFLLAFAVLPLTLVIATTVPVNAVIYGDPHAATVSDDTWRPGDKITCNISAGYAVSPGVSVWVEGRMLCSGGWNSELGEDPDASMSLTFHAETPQGQTCGGGHWSSDTEPMGTDGPYDDVTFSSTQLTEAAGGELSCEVEEVCWGYVIPASWPADSRVYEDCAALVMGPPPAEQPTCAYGAPMMVSAEVGNLDPNNGGKYEARVVIRFANYVPTAQGWYVWPVTQNDGAPLGTWQSHQLTTDPGGATPTTVTWDGDTVTLEKAFSTTSPDLGRAVIGVQLVERQGNSEGTPSWNFGVTNPNTNTDYGLTRPHRCWFWVGDKIRDIAGDDDEPWSTLDAPVDDPPVHEPTPVDPESGNCTFSISDPETWIAGGICALVGLMAQALNVLAAILGVLESALGLLTSLVNLLTGLVDEIGGLLTALFVPTPGVWGFGDLRDQAEAKPPFSVAGQLTTEAGAVAGEFEAAGSCGVLADFGDGMALNCGQIKDAPGLGMLYGLAQGTLFLLTGWSMFLIASRLFEEGQ